MLPTSVRRVMCNLIGHKLVTDERAFRHSITAVLCLRCGFKAGRWVQ